MTPEVLTTAATVVIALFTAVLGIFTVRLAISTRAAADAARIAADAAKRSADVAVAIELPTLLVVSVELEYRSWSSAMGSDKVYKAPSRIKIALKNFGRTPAIMTSYCAHWKVADALPDSPVYSGIVRCPSGTVVAPDEIESLEPDTWNLELAPADAEAINAGDTNLWVYGFISFRDFLGQQHTTGYCAVWRDGVFIEEGSEKYIYRNQLPNGEFARNSETCAGTRTLRYRG